MIKSGLNVNLLWIPSHFGITGNEINDSLAKVGYNFPQPDLPKSYHSIKRIITVKFNASYHETITNLTNGKIWDFLWDNPFPYDLPRQVGALLTSGTILYYLKRHIHWFRLVEALWIAYFAWLMSGDHLNCCSGLIDVITVNAAKNFSHFDSVFEL